MSNNEWYKKYKNINRMLVEDGAVYINNFPENLISPR